MFFNMVNRKTTNLSGSGSSNDGSSSKSSLGAWLSLGKNQLHPYECPRCYRTFPTSQALGGHQNAHRKERSEECRLFVEACRARKKQKMVLPHPYTPAIRVAAPAAPTVPANNVQLDFHPFRFPPPPQPQGPPPAPLSASGSSYGPVTLSLGCGPQNGVGNCVEYEIPIVGLNDGYSHRHPVQMPVELNLTLGDEGDDDGDEKVMKGGRNGDQNAMRWVEDSASAVGENGLASDNFNEITSDNEKEIDLTLRL